MVVDCQIFPVLLSGEIHGIPAQFLSHRFVIQRIFQAKGAKEADLIAEIGGLLPSGSH